MPKKISYSQIDLTNAIKNSTSLREVALKLNLNQDGGGTYFTLKKYIKLWNIDISHFDGQGWNKKLKFNPNPKKPLNDILKPNVKYRTSFLRTRLIDEGVLKNECSICYITEWQGKPLDLHLDHINGDHFDNSISNLRILCPNCHSQTDTYCGKNYGKYTKKGKFKI